MQAAEDNSMAQLDSGRIWADDNDDDEDEGITGTNVISFRKLYFYKISCIVRVQLFTSTSRMLSKTDTYVILILFTRVDEVTEPVCDVTQVIDWRHTINAW